VTSRGLHDHRPRSETRTSLCLWIRRGRALGHPLGHRLRGVPRAPHSRGTCPAASPRRCDHATAPGAGTTGDQASATPTWDYSPIGKRDPFHSFLAEIEEQEANEGQHKREETEKYELDQYRLTGLVTDTAQPSAMVEDPTGMGHVVHIGSRLARTVVGSPASLPTASS